MSLRQSRRKYGQADKTKANLYDVLTPKTKTVF